MINNIIRLVHIITNLKYDYCGNFCCKLTENRRLLPEGVK
jgi:hypothetical protein